MSRPDALRPISCFRVPWRMEGADAGNLTERWQDKRAHIARRSDDTICQVFRPAPHIAARKGNVRRTLEALCSRRLFHIAGQRHGR